jgi:hypothetical protein
MAKGDHLYVSFLFNGCPITHHAIDCGNGYVIQFDGYDKGGKVVKIPRSEFGKGRQVKIKTYSKCDAPDTVMIRAYTLLDREGYSIFTNNCEHLAHFCKTGIKKSEQVRNAVAVVAGGAVKGVTGVGVKMATSAASKAATEAAIRTSNPIARTLINVGLKQAPKAVVAGRAAAGIASMGGVVTGLATDAVMGKILEDDEHLSQRERDARNTGRNAGKAGSLVGSIGGAVAAGVVSGGAAIGTAVAAPVVLGVGIGLGAYHLSKGKD